MWIKLGLMLQFLGAIIWAENFGRPDHFSKERSAPLAPLPAVEVAVSDTNTDPCLLGVLESRKIRRCDTPKISYKIGKTILGYCSFGMSFFS